MDATKRAIGRPHAKMTLESNATAGAWQSDGRLGNGDGSKSMKETMNTPVVLPVTHAASVSSIILWSTEKKAVGP